MDFPSLPPLALSVLPDLMCNNRCSEILNVLLKDGFPVATSLGAACRRIYNNKKNYCRVPQKIDPVKEFATSVKKGS